MNEKQLFSLSAFLAALAEQSKSDAPQNFRKNVLFTLCTYLDFDGAIWGEAHVTNQMVLHKPEIIGLPSSDLSDLQSAAYSDPHMKLVFDQPGTPVAYSVEADASKSLIEYAEKNEIGHIMSTAQFDMEIGLASGLVLTRRKSAASFDEVETAFMHAIFPHLIRCWAENQIDYLRSEIQKRQKNTLYAAVSSAGNISGIEKGFFSMLRREWPGCSGPNLPEPIRELLLEGTLTSYTGIRVVVRCYHAEDLRLLVVREFRPADRLTPKQLSVARLCADGFSYRDIADKLSIAPSTARNHIAAVHERLGVNRNSEIARRLDEIL